MRGDGVDHRGAGLDALATLPDLRRAAQGLGGIRLPIAPAAPFPTPRPLIPGTARFAAPFVANGHRTPPGTAQDLALYVLPETILSGTGQVWLDDRLVTDPAIMPGATARALGVHGAGSPALHAAAALPIRSIPRPCLVATGPCPMEALFRILLARHALARAGITYAVLLDTAAPAWLLHLMDRHLGLPPAMLEFCDPATERVALPHALIPTRIMQDGGIHPLADTLLDDLLATLPPAPATPARIFIPQSNPTRHCTNEPALIAIAESQGFTPVTLGTPETIPLLHSATHITGLAGPPLHASLFAAPGTKIASVGFTGPTQSHIGALRAHDTAYLMRVAEPEGDYFVDEATFTAFLDAVCMS